MASVLVTGATGLLGSRVIEDLHGEHEVTALARRQPLEAPPSVRWLVHDLSEPHLPHKLPARIDAVVHLAQSRSFREFPNRALDIFNVNVGSTALLLDWATRAGAQTFVYASTGGVYPPTFGAHVEDERVDLSAPSFYVGSKLAGEALAHAYASELVVVVLRFFFIYGPGQDRSMLIPRVVDSVASGQPISLQGQDGIRVTPTHVDDAASAVTGALRLSTSVTVNVAGPEVLSLRQVGDIVGSRLGTSPTYRVSDDSPSCHFVADISTMMALLGAPRTTFEEGVGELCRAAATSRGAAR